MSTMYDKTIRSLRDYYERDADSRDARTKERWKLEERDLFLSRLREERLETLLEVGAGTGQDSKFFADAGIEVTATDLSPRMVELCRRKGLDAHVMDFLSIDFGGRKFDALYGVNCLLHVPRTDVSKVLAHFSELLRSGGLMYVGLYGGRDESAERDGPFGERLFVSYTDESIRRVVEQDFRIERFHRIELPDEGFPDCYQSLVARKA